jgi:outer membrane protein assembly factor BamA
VIALAHRRAWLALIAWVLVLLVPWGSHAAPPDAEAPPVEDDAPPVEDDAPPVEDDAPPVENGEPPPVDIEAPPPPGSEDPPAPTAEDEPPAEGECDIANRGDPLHPVVRTLESMKAGRLEIVACAQIYERGFRAVQAVIRGQGQDLMLYLLERLAADGFEIMLVPTGTHEVELLATAAAGSGWVYYTGVERLSLHGSFVSGDDSARVATIIGLHSGNFFPFEYRDRLREIGYASDFFPVAAGEVVIEVRPGRSIRRVRVRGHLPLAKRDILRQLSIEAQPGALARGQCVEPEKLRGGDPPPICSARDVACLEWERDETERVDQFLFDSGYLNGSARLALVCGRDDDEADLHVLLSKGKPFKIDRRHVDVVDLDAANAAADATERQPLPERDARWIRRQFIPKALGVVRTRVTREFMDKAVEKVERAYAEPNTSLGRFWRSTDGLPYPEVEVGTSYEELTRESELPRDRNLPLEVRVSRGAGVLTEFRPMPGSKHRTRRPSGLSFSDTQLRSKVQLFNRREPATPAGAQRESANIRAYYQSKGYLFARVRGEHLDFKSLDKLRFEIQEGPKVTIADVELRHSPMVTESVTKRINALWLDDRELRRRGAFAESDALADIQTVLAAYNAEGYLCANVIIDIAFWEAGLDDPGTHAELDVQTLLDSGGDPKWIEQFDAEGLAGVLAADRADVWVRIRVDPGPRLLTGPREEVHYLEEPIPYSRKVEGLLERDATGEVQWGAPRMLRDGPLRRRKDDDEAGGVAVTPNLDREARRSVVARYHDNGYPVADAELTWSYTSPSGDRVIVDDARNLGEPRYGICLGRRDEPVVIVDPVINVYEGRRGEFGDILFRGNFKTRTWVLERELEFESGDPYSQRLIDRSAAAIESTGVAKSVTISPYPNGCHLAEKGPCKVHQVVAIEEAKDLSMTIDYGIGIATLNPFYVFANPAFPNMFGTGWDLSLESRWGFDLSQVLEQSELCAGQECYERLAAANLSRRQIFATPFDLDISGRVQRRATPARGRIDTLIGSLRISRRFQDWTFYGGYLIQLANISKDVVKPLAGSEDGWINRGGGVASNLTGLIDTGVVLTRVDNAFNPYDGFIATMDIKLASPWFGGHDWWARLDLSWQHFIPIPGTADRLNFRYALRYGHLVPFSGPGVERGTRVETETVPDVWRYYGGGTADLGLRGILPETMLVDLEEIELPYGGTLLRPRAQGGHIRALGSVAFQVTSVKDVLGGSLAHSLFYDFGILTQFWQDVRLPRDFRHSIGVNFLKFDIRIVTMALGYAILLPGRYNVGPTDDRNGRFVFDVGVTF